MAEFLDSLDTVEALGARLCLPGHGRPFGDVAAHVDANRKEMAATLDEIEGVSASRS